MIYSDLKLSMCTNVTKFSQATGHIIVEPKTKVSKPIRVSIIRARVSPQDVGFWPDTGPANHPRGFHKILI
jgi:hypothetical protein